MTSSFITACGETMSVRGGGGAAAPLIIHGSVQCNSGSPSPLQQIPRLLSFSSSSGRISSNSDRHGNQRSIISIVCLAHPRRVKMVAQQIRRELADMLIRDKVLQHAILPESTVGADMYLSSVATITDVELSNDLQVAKVYISIFSDDKGKEMVMEGLKAKTKYVRAGLGKRMQLRLTPDVRFIMDDSLERGTRVLAILDRLEKERKEKEGGDTAHLSDDDDNDNWDDILDEEVSKTTSPKPSGLERTGSL